MLQYPVITFDPNVYVYAPLALYQFTFGKYGTGNYNGR